MALDPMRVKALLQSALDVSDAAERAAFLDRECRGDPELRRRLDELLSTVHGPDTGRDHPVETSIDATTEQPAKPLGPGSDAPTVAQPEDMASVRAPAASASIGALIAGRYRLRQEIGEGGMGTVYLADQIQPVKRQVALKLIKPGMDSRQILARFEGERQALALMDHPNIARVLDAGATDDGRPFFVMELVKGVPITEYCDGQRLGLAGRLAILRHVCAAVQHAHQKGVIHRDLKPSNILVESHDGVPVPKVIDFGLAKATSGVPLTEQSLHSAFGTVAGTPLYMAPEQATFDAIDIDTRADVYALGVVLYELLTGTTPITREQMKRSALDEMFRLIRESEPPTPSRRIGTSEALPSLAALRQTEPARLGRFLKGDLDWITMKALARERQRRYETPSALARDIERFLNHEPVSAGPPTATYRVKKFVRRHRAAVTAASLVLLALVAGIVGTTLGLFEARRHEARALKAAAHESAARRAVQAEHAKAEARLQQLETANTILGSVFRDLNPREAEKHGKPLQAVLGERLDEAAKQLEGESIGDPLTVARMQHTLGLSQLNLGHAQRALDLFTRAHDTFTRALGPDHRETLACRANLGMALFNAGRDAEAVAQWEQTLGRWKATLGPDDPETLSTTSSLAMGYQRAGRVRESLELHEHVLARREAELGPDHPDTLAALIALATAYRDASRLADAIPLFEKALKVSEATLGPDHLDTVDTLTRLATCYQDAGRLPDATRLLERSLEVRRAKLGRDHPETLVSLGFLAGAFYASGRYSDAVPMFEQALELTRARHGPDHPDTLASMNNLAQGYTAAGRPADALPLLEEALARDRRLLGPDHPHTQITAFNLALRYLDLGRVEESLAMQKDVQERLTARLGADHPEAITSLKGLATTYSQTGKHDLALPLFERALELRRAKLGPDHPETLMALNDLAACLWSLRRLDRSVPLFEESLGRFRAVLGPAHPNTLITQANLGVNYKDAGRLDEALPLLESAYERTRGDPQFRWVAGQLMEAYVLAGPLADDRRARAVSLVEGALTDGRKMLPAGSAERAGLLAQAGLILLNCERPGDAEPPLRECLEIRERLLPDDWRTAYTRSTLGAALLALNRTDEAEPLLRSGYENMQKLLEKIPPPIRARRLVEGLDRLIAWAEAAGKPEEAETWKAEKAKRAEASSTPAPEAK
jgi:serine/threonine protein kinase/tetratricopeptide (TPR) repeat protein